MRRRAIRAATIMALVILLLPVLAAAAPGQRPAGSGSRGAGGHGKISGAIGGTTGRAMGTAGVMGAAGAMGTVGVMGTGSSTGTTGAMGMVSRARVQVVLRRLRLGVRGGRPRDVAVVGIFAGLCGPGVPPIRRIPSIRLLSCCLSRVRISAAYRRPAPCARCSGRARRAWLDDADAGALVLAAGTSAGSSEDPRRQGPVPPPLPRHPRRLRDRHRRRPLADARLLRRPALDGLGSDDHPVVCR